MKHGPHSDPRTMRLSSLQPFALSGGQRVSVLLYHRHGVEVLPLSADRPLVVGRAAPADVIVEDGSLSRQHARFELVDDRVWVEDLGSTNGTRVNGEPLTSRRGLDVDDRLTLGSIDASIHALAPSDPQLSGLVPHDRFIDALDEEVTRHRTFGRTLGVVLLRAIGREPLIRWCPALQKSLRPVDRIGLYGPTMVEIAVPETDDDQLKKTAEALIRADRTPLVCGLALFPRSGRSTEELLEAAREAAHRATAEHPIALAAAEPVAPAGEAVVSGRSMQQVFAAVDRLARAQIPVLITGETGSGKEVVARALHQRGPRAQKPLRCINCAAIAQHLLESALFGHEKGAFTGADRRTKGVFEAADGGTVLLDEVGELSAAAQASLLRVLETKTVQRVGSTAEIPVDVRVLAATHRNLEAMCEAGSFRWDLLYRLNTMVLKVPPLRERREEIGSLADHFREEANRENGCAVAGIEARALERLQSHPWPGNVRELRNVIHRAVVMATSDRITVEDLPESVAGTEPAREREAPAAATPTAADEIDALLADDRDFKDRVQDFETALIERALQHCDGNQTEAAKLLRIPIRTLSYKIKAFGIAQPS